MSFVFALNKIFDPLQSLVLQCQSGYKAADLKECVGILHDLQLSRKGSSLVAVREKYNQHKVNIFAFIDMFLCYFAYGS